MKTLLFVLVFTGNLFSQTVTTADTMTINDDEWANITDESYITWATVTGTGVTDVEIAITFEDCKGDDLMFNYRTEQIQEINRGAFGDSEAKMFLIQTPLALASYQWMRKNRTQYTIWETVVRVNRFASKSWRNY